VPRTSQISFYPTRETAFAVFSCGSSNVNVLGMEIIMSNSSLIDVVIKSPNCDSPRNNTIRGITIHHMAAVWSVEECGESFANPQRQASANYGIDGDGRVGLYVDENDRAWTSGDAQNDNETITIEIANSEIGGEWPVSDAAYAKLIDLCVDICQRNNIEKLNYTGDISGNLIIHKMFQSTICPGPFLEARMSDIANQVNARLTTTEDTVDIDVDYQVQLEENGIWLPMVRNLSDYAGIIGKQIIGIAIKVSKGYALYRVHDAGGWYGMVDTRNTNINDFQNGYAGNNKPIDALEIYYYTPDEVAAQHGYKKAVYRVSPVNDAYYDWQYDNETSQGQDGYAGVFGRYIDRVQIAIK